MGVNRYEVWVGDEKDSGFNERLDAIDTARGIAKREPEKANEIVVYDNYSKFPKHIRIQWREQSGLKSVSGRWRPRYDS